MLPIIALLTFAIIRLPSRPVQPPAEEEEDVRQRVRCRGHQRARRALERYYPKGVISLLATNGTKIIPLRTKTRSVQASPALRRLSVNVDRWPVPPAGLFVVEERATYLRSTSAMTDCYEFGHAPDLALGDGVYLSGQDVRIRKAVNDARGFVPPTRRAGSTNTSKL
jgi:hypothetical protein